ncbi:MAG: hypothetical protein LQ350_008595, partial [Teloschistes chrysophthalmus]
MPPNPNRAAAASKKRVCPANFSPQKATKRMGAGEHVSKGSARPPLMQMSGNTKLVDPAAQRAEAATAAQGISASKGKGKKSTRTVREDAEKRASVANNQENECEELATLDIDAEADELQIEDGTTAQTLNTCIQETKESGRGPR